MEKQMGRIRDVTVLFRVHNSYVEDLYFYSEKALIR